MRSNYPELLALAYIANLWSITTALCALRTSEAIRIGAHANLMMCRGLLWEYYERPTAQVLEFTPRLRESV